MTLVIKSLPRYTLSRGDVVSSDGKIGAEEDRGRCVERPPFPAVNQALSSWKALTTPQPVERSAADVPIGV